MGKKDNVSTSFPPTQSPKKSTSSTGRSKNNTKVMPPYNLVVDSNDSNNSFDELFNGVVNLLHGRKNVIVLVGAGISTSCGIPDFRSKSNGLYESLDTAALGLSCPEELFCYDFFQHNPKPFYKFAQHLYHPLGPDQKIEPSDSHKLLALLEEKKMLLRVYT